jgi:hypothetical protein
MRAAPGSDCLPGADPVFATRSVEPYIVVSTRNEFGSGDWQAYRDQDRFTLSLDERPGKLVLPSEVEGAVHLFRRKQSA